MDKNKLLSLFNKEKERVRDQVFSPIIKSIKDKEYDAFFDYFIVLNINQEIEKEHIDLLTLNSPINYKDKINAGYLQIYQKVINKILETSHFGIFKIVFGEKDFQDWALSFFKYILYSYFKTVKKTELIVEIQNNIFDYEKYLNKSDFDGIIFSCFKTLFGYSYTGIMTFEYWERITKINSKMYSSLVKIATANNPTIYLVNSFLYYWQKEKNRIYDKTKFHINNSFTPIDKKLLNDKNLAYNWILDYLTCLILNQKIQVGIWKAMQNLLFGIQTKNNHFLVMRTLTEININIQSVWKLDKISLNFFKMLKFQTILDLPTPNTFQEFIQQDTSYLLNTVSPKLNKFLEINKKIS